MVQQKVKDEGGVNVYIEVLPTGHEGIKKMEEGMVNTSGHEGITKMEVGMVNTSGHEGITKMEVGMVNTSGHQVT